ncbi:MAG: hypothetical protein U5L09_20635 [Bacteroidales bacterium]|nr:hypothetical protein [Bacteroidales bacterium]
MKMEDGVHHQPYKPALSLIEFTEKTEQVVFDDFGLNNTRKRGVPVIETEVENGESVKTATVYDLLMAQYGIDRGLPGDYPGEQGYYNKVCRLYSGLAGNLYRHR